MALVRYTLGAYKHSSTLFKGIQSSQISPNMQQIIAASSGAIDPTFVAVGRLQPQISFTALTIKTILNACGISGAAMASDKAFFQKMTDDGGRAGAISHMQITMANGLIIPTSIQASALPAPATISCLATPRSADGSASPLAIVVNASLEVGQDADTEVYVLGAVTINGTELEGVDDWSLDFGIALDITFGSGHVYPTYLGIMARNPRFTIRTFDLAKFQSWAETGIAQSDTDSTVVLQDQLASGVRGSSPITFSIDAGMAHFETVGADQGNKGVGQVTITPVSDGTNAIIAIAGLT